MRHQIEVKGLLEFKNQEIVKYASSSSEKKQLYITLNGTYEVYHNNEMVFQSYKPDLAVDFYNNI